MKKQIDYGQDPDGKLQRKLLWISANKRYVVVEGPFPYGFVRSLDSASIEGAAKMVQADVYSRPETSKTGRYAKVRRSDIILTHNEFGEIAP